MSNQSGLRQRTELPFRRAEWELLVKLPGRVVVAATSAAHADPTRRTVAEGLAGIDAIAAGRASASRLVRDIVAAIYDEAGAAGEYPQPEVLDACRTALRLLTERAGRVDADAYRHWLVAIAARVCRAARTGVTLGLGDQPISVAEREFLARLEAALTG